MYLRTVPFPPLRSYLEEENADFETLNSGRRTRGHHNNTHRNNDTFLHRSLRGPFLHRPPPPKPELRNRRPESLDRDQPGRPGRRFRRLPRQP